MWKRLDHCVEEWHSRVSMLLDLLEEFIEVKDAMND